MELVLISKSKGTRARIRVEWPLLSAALLACALALAGTTYWGYQRGASQVSEVILNDSSYSTSFWQREIVAQRKTLNDLRDASQSDLIALASKIGGLQAHIIRLDAVATRVVAAANLDPVEFDLSHSPALGGPQPQQIDRPSWLHLVDNVQSLSLNLEIREEHLDALEAILLDRQLQDDRPPTGKPLPGGWMSSGFGYRTHPVSGMREFHTGIDFAGKFGMEIQAIGDGVVTWSGRRWGYGNVVEINHGNGNVTRYAHNKKNLVEVGEMVSRGQAIALLGSTGRSTGPHVHFEVIRDNKAVNPWEFIDHTNASN